MRTVTKTVYSYSELNDKAKAAARDWYRQAGQGDNSFSEVVITDAEEVGKVLGIEFERDKKTSEPLIVWSGFSSQGDGASFTGRYAFNPGAVDAIRETCPTDTRLHAIAAGLAEVQQRYNGALVATLTRRSHHYAHEHTIDIAVEDEQTDAITADDTTRIAEALRAFMRWIYRQLETQYEHENSDAVITENIEANEYEFEADGRRTRD